MSATQHFDHASDAGFRDRGHMRIGGQLGMPRRSAARYVFQIERGKIDG